MEFLTRTGAKVVPLVIVDAQEALAPEYLGTRRSNPPVKSKRCWIIEAETHSHRDREAVPHCDRFR
jgi:hypothetical protein